MTERNSDKSKTVSKQCQEYCRLSRNVFMLTKLTLILTLNDPHDRNLTLNDPHND